MPAATMVPQPGPEHGSRLDVRLRVMSAGLLALPWREPLGEWDPTTVSFRDIPVGLSRHLVRFVEADGELWALKEMPQWVALREYAVLREMEVRSLAAVRAAGLVLQTFDDTAILVTHYLERSWQYRRLLMRLPITMHAHRARLFHAIAALLVDLHRNGVYWGDCSLANTLFMRDGQAIQAWMVDAETAELEPALTDGQRVHDLDIMVENVLGGLMDLAARLDQPDEVSDQLVAESEGVVNRYHQLWDLLHEEPVIDLADRYQVETRLRRLNDLGFAVDEVHLEAADDGSERLRLSVAVAGRTFHAEQLRALTGLDVLEGQATVLLNDLKAFQSRACKELGHDAPDAQAARDWLSQVLVPGMDRAHAARDHLGDPIQAYCDLLEVRWLLSEEAGFDVGDGPALAALAQGTTPGESAATMAIVDVATRQLPAIDDGWPDELEV